jgi:thiaminase
MDNLLASISIIKTYIKNLERITENLKFLKQANESALGSEEANNSKKIDTSVKAGMELQNKANDLMKTITELLQTLKEDVNTIFISANIKSYLIYLYNF